MQAREEIKTGYNHNEAFRHMRYRGQKKNNVIDLTIWNSRDGVTPFITYSKEYGIQLEHIDWRNDKLELNYKPKAGDLIWMSHNEETARKSAEEVFQNLTDVLATICTMTDEAVLAKFHYDAKAMFEEKLSNKEQFITEHLEHLLTEHGEPQPHLHLVEKDWI